jgi:heme-degrading monooxygenase HmoA
VSPASPPGPAVAAGQVVTVFRSRLTARAGDEYEETAEAMEAAARAVPGFVDFKTFTADDGERVSLITFADRASHDAWRSDERHRRAQQAGRDRFYAGYQIQVCDCVAVRRFAADPTRS